MPRFEVIGKGRTTGRQRKRVYEAPTEENARRQAEAEGTLVSTVVDLPPEPPTEGQLQAAREHGISIPAGITKDELNDLISLSTWRDKQASSDLQTIAQGYGIKVTKYSGKRLLFQRIFDQLAQPGHEEDLAAWFAYRVYRELVAGSLVSRVKSPDDPLIRTIARQLAQDGSVIQSIRRYQGADLVWFGKWTSPSGTVHDGGSNRTMAYKKAAELLRPFASSEQRMGAVEGARRDNERPAPPMLTVAADRAEGIGGWMVRTEESMRAKNSKPLKITRWHVVAWTVIASAILILIFGPRT
jgi:hypothetical protein